MSKYKEFKHPYLIRLGILILWTVLCMIFVYWLDIHSGWTETTQKIIGYPFTLFTIIGMVILPEHILYKLEGY